MKRLISLVLVAALLISFSFVFAESVTVVISGSNVTSKPSGWDGNSTYNRVVHYPTTDSSSLLNSYYNAFSFSDIGYVTYDRLFQNTGNVQYPYTIRNYLSVNLPSVTSWVPSNPHSYTVGSSGATLNYTSISGANDMLQLVPVSNVLLTPGVHYLLSVSLSSISELQAVGFVDYPSEVTVVDTVIALSEVAGQTIFNGQISFTVSAPVSIRSLPVRSVFVNDSSAEVYQYSLSYSGYESNEDVVQAIKDQTQHFEDSFGGAVNPGQAGANQEIQDNVGQLEDFDNKIFTDVSDYTSQLDFGLGDWSEAAAGISYIGSIFMLIWDNSPTQVIVLSLMVGLCLLILGRGPRVAGEVRRHEERASRRKKGG